MRVLHEGAIDQKTVIVSYLLGLQAEGNSAITDKSGSRVQILMGVYLKFSLNESMIKYCSTSCPPQSLPRHPLAPENWGWRKV
jgi:hypothetical protein